MKKNKFHSVFTACLLLLSFMAAAQKNTIDQAFKTSAIESLNQLMNDHYVFPEVAKKTEAHLLKQLADGHFDSYNDLGSFAGALTESVQSVNHDKHMRIRPVPPRNAAENTPEGIIEDILEDLDGRREFAGGFHEVKKLEGNVGYLDLRGFAGPEEGFPVADSYMSLLSNTDAIIIDLRENGGGHPDMVQYLCSYFFDEHVHLNSLYWREGDVTNEFWTLDKVAGKKLPDIPLFILTSPRTFSAAEEFSYNMQTQKRATLVGETTGGGANPGGGFPINQKMFVFIPTGKAINPITKTNWEGTGVIPEIKTTAGNTFDKAYELAKTAAGKYRRKKYDLHVSYLKNMQASIDNYTPGQSYQSVFEKINTCVKADLIGEEDINEMGYEYMARRNKPEIAELIFQTNTDIFPNSANVYDSYGEALARNGKLNASIEAYKKAVNLATENNDPNLELFKENLKGVQEEKKDRN